MCKLLLSRRILSEKLLAKLLVLWYNPVTQEETNLRSILGLFFPSFAALDRLATPTFITLRAREGVGRGTTIRRSIHVCRSSRLSLSEVYLPVMRMVLEAPPSSPLASISTSNLSDFVIQLTRPIDASVSLYFLSVCLFYC